jgi:hypothetical protein
MTLRIAIGAGERAAPMAEQLASSRSRGTAVQLSGTNGFARGEKLWMAREDFLSRCRFRR